ncbi:MAG TPA: ester cyclase [Candidatus Limnocylindrales bacterium]|nr:ester cyclase [Candidatus Limnocylindrales bacterium]
MQENEELYRRLIDEGFNRGDLAVADEVVAPGAIEHQRSGMGDGPEGVKRVIGTLRSAFPDFELRIEDLVVDGDRVWARQRGGGTNLGSFFGRPPTGKRVFIDVFDVARFAEGKLVEHWGVPDQLGMLMELGLLAH